MIKYIVVNMDIERIILTCEYITKGIKIGGTNQKIESTNVVIELDSVGL